VTVDDGCITTGEVVGGMEQATKEQISKHGKTILINIFYVSAQAA